MSSSPQQFANKVIAITGGASGIGLATAHLLASRGARLSLADLSQEGLERAKAEIQAAHPSAEVLTTALDVRRADAVDAWVRDTVSRLGGLDGAANLAGVIPASIGTRGVAQQDAAEWEFVVGVNLTGVMHCLRAQLAVMTAAEGGARGGSVVNASSIAGLTGRENNASYAASKHGVLGLTRSAAKEVGVKGIRVNSICPGRIDTPMARNAAAISKDSGSILGVSGNADAFSDVALKRSGTAEEVAKLIAFLLSDESTYITGTSISIDGGWFC